jgi:hypothetical protein
VKVNEAVLKIIVRIAREQLVNTVTNEYSMKMFIKDLFLFFLLEIFYKLSLFFFHFSRQCDADPDIMPKIADTFFKLAQVAIASNN